MGQERETNRGHPKAGRGSKGLRREEEKAGAVNIAPC